MRLEDLRPDMSVNGFVPGAPVDLIAVVRIGADTVRVVYRMSDGALGEQILMRSNEPGLRESTAPKTPFDADPVEFKLAAEALRIQAAAYIDPMLAVTSSQVEPLPHQLEAVYGQLLDHVPLRFLLADDPGAGKTIMAGLYIKELALRNDLERCLIVAPGGLVEQWQDELAEKFGLRFPILTGEMVIAMPRGDNVFVEHSRLIVRMDQVARSEQLLTDLSRSTWDVVVIDEAHRMSAHYYGREISQTRRYALGKLLGGVAENLLLMTATPHTGKETDFQLFLALLDADRFEGRYREGTHRTGADGLMLRRVKEELLTFAGKPLFPQRAAYTVPYELSEPEGRLYEAVTEYVRQQFNRADQLSGARGNTVGFALTVLQRRLASSPEAILRSLERRRARLLKRLEEATYTAGPTVSTLAEAYDEFPSGDSERIEDEVVDAATAARTAAELELEIAALAELVVLARQVRESGTDRKWTELRDLLERSPEVAADSKLIVFTEHRDTLTYLAQRVGELCGGPEAVATIHGGLSRDDRRAVQTRFLTDPACRVLVATDAAGEGLNLQRAHLMVNYDLPWNPNRLEQRFGRIHRIGQTKMCHLWNLVAANTREGAVFRRLLSKVEEQNVGLRGKVFDVLGEAFEGMPLHQLLVEAIRRGEDPDVQRYLERVIDERVGDTAVKLVNDRALHHDVLTVSDMHQVRIDLEEARARRLQPHYVEGFFRDAFAALGGHIVPREQSRFQIMEVPSPVREHRTALTPIALRYERVCFDRDAVRQGRLVADLLAPGHPLLDAVVAETVARFRTALERGTVLVDRLDPGEEIRLLAAVAEEIVDGAGRSVDKQFGFVELWQDGRTRPGAAPFLDYATPDSREQALVADLASRGWPAGARRVAEAWAADQDLPSWYESVSRRRQEMVDRARGLVRERLEREIDLAAEQRERLDHVLVVDGGVREKRRAADNRIADLRRRLAERLSELDLEAHTQARPPAVAAIALVVPQGLLDRLSGRRHEPVRHYSATMAEIEQRAIEVVLSAERRLGRVPEVLAHNNPGYDVRSADEEGHLVHIEVKGREEGAVDFFVTNREIRVGQNADNYRLALVEVHLDDPNQDEVRYLRHPFAAEKVSALVNSVQFKWNDMWQRGDQPS